jgi:peptide/nickel transport system permease protein
MTRYVLMRLAQGVLTLFVLVTLVFVLARVIGNPVDMMLPSDATDADREWAIHVLGLDQPVEVQYVTFISGFLTGNIGDSINFNRPVMELFPNTIRLAAVTLVIALVFGFGMGMVSAVRRGSAVDHLVRGLSVIGVSAPAFWVGLMLMSIFALRLNLFPVARMGGPDSYVLPAVTWSLFLLAGTARLVRSSMLEVMESEYVKLARIKGVSPNVVLWKHCLRNALLPVVTFAGMQLALLLSGSVVVESVFAWPGVGRLVYQGITGRDYPLVQGCLLLIGAVIVVINLAVDLLYAYMDPRSRFDGGQ